MAFIMCIYISNDAVKLMVMVAVLTEFGTSDIVDLLYFNEMCPYADK